MINPEPYLVQALKVEISVMKTFKGAHCVKLIDLLETSHNHYIVLELCNGGDL